jgi:maltose O-acetyltransferase
MCADERRSMVCNDGVTRYLIYARPVTIGHDCWFGANVTVCPGVTIGDNCVIGAGSVVTRDIPSDSFAAGVPAKVIRTITEKESVRDLLDY